MYPLKCVLNISYMLYNMQKCNGMVLNHQQMLFVEYWLSYMNKNVLWSEKIKDVFHKICLFWGSNPIINLFNTQKSFHIKFLIV